MSDNENETTSSPSPSVDYSSDDIHDEVECMLAGNNEEIIELISTDPKYYLGIIENYKNMRDGKEIYLPDLFNVLVSRSDTSMNIKFKMSDNSQWHEVGFNGGDFDETEVYNSFTVKVKHLLKNPPISRRAFLEDTMQPTVNRPPPMVNQGNQNKLSKIDRFLGRTEHAFDSTCTISSQKPLSPDPLIEHQVNALGEPMRLPGGTNENTPDVKPSTVVTQSPSKPSIGNLSHRLDKLRQSCPEMLLDDYQKLSKLLNSNSPFINGLLSLTTDIDRARANLIYQFLIDSPL